MTALCRAGMNVARLNFSHGTHEEHQKKIDMIKQVREKLNYPLPIMLDTKGPEYRIKTFRDKKSVLKEEPTIDYEKRFASTEFPLSGGHHWHDRLRESLETIN